MSAARATLGIGAVRLGNEAFVSFAIMAWMDDAIASPELLAMSAAMASSLTISGTEDVLSLHATKPIAAATSANEENWVTFT
jgi:hypothetical protein